MPPISRRRCISAREIRIDVTLRRSAGCRRLALCHRRIAALIVGGRAVDLQAHRVIGAISLRVRRATGEKRSKCESSQSQNTHHKLPSRQVGPAAWLSPCCLNSGSKSLSEHTGSFVSRQFTVTRVEWSFSIGGIAARFREARRPRTIAVLISVRVVRLAGIKGIGDAGQMPPRGRRHALTVAVEGAVAQARIFLTLKAERMSRADGFRRQRAEHRKAARSQNRNDNMTHEDLLDDSFEPRSLR